jgi:GNAT superfamily N-acetyltransferase
MGERIDPEHVMVRRATIQDVSEIVRMLADDKLGRHRERYADPLPEAYYRAFQRIEADPSAELVVAEVNGAVVGTLHLSFLTYLTHEGGTRAQIEAVRVDRLYRGRGLGEYLIRWAIERARAQGCNLVQLTTNAARADAHRFYERLGFVGSHVGMKLDLLVRSGQADGVRERVGLDRKLGSQQHVEDDET